MLRVGEEAETVKLCEIGAAISGWSLVYRRSNGGIVIRVIIDIVVYGVGVQVALRDVRQNSVKYSTTQRFVERLGARLDILKLLRISVVDRSASKRRTPERAREVDEFGIQIAYCADLRILVSVKRVLDLETCQSLVRSFRGRLVIHKFHWQGHL